MVTGGGGRSPKFACSTSAALTEIAGIGEFVDGICSALLKDLDALVEFAKKNGSEEAKRIPYTSWTGRSSNSFDESVAGEYFGFNLSGGGFNLGFLEEPVVAALRKLFEKMGGEYVASKSYSVETITVPVHVSGGVYVTSSGVFEISRTHSIYVLKRV
ncbi:MAG: hypothetical protein WAW90_02290 [Minisyncoccia bacterium]